MMDVPLLGKLPPLTKHNEVTELVDRSTSPSSKKRDFFILYNTTGVDGRPLPDAKFAEHLQEVLQQEKLMNGKGVRVVSANETNQNIHEVLTQMSQSVVVLVVFSEAALKTFAGEVHNYAQNNYLLFLQFALRLHHNSGVRMLGLNIVALDEGEPLPTFVKFEGWCVRFDNVAHHSEWIQDSISTSMKEIFAIQGVNIDLEDWEYKINIIFATLYAMQDDLNATKWLSTFKIIPWKSVLGLIGTFLFCLFFPIVGYLIVKCSLWISRASPHNKKARLNAALFGTGFNILFIGTMFFVIAVMKAANGALCSSLEKCEVLVRSGARWALWRVVSIDYCGSLCYDPIFNEANGWTTSFPDGCAECVCQNLHDGVTYDSNDIISKNCDVGAGWAVACCVLFVTGLWILVAASKRFRKETTAMVAGQTATQDSTVTMEMHTVV